MSEFSSTHCWWKPTRWASQSGICQNCRIASPSLATRSWILCQRLKLASKKLLTTVLIFIPQHYPAMKRNTTHKVHNYIRGTVLILEDEPVATVNCALLCIWVFPSNYFRETLAKNFSSL